MMDLTNSIAELSIQAAEKEEELNKVKTELTKAKKASARSVRIHEASNCIYV